MSSEVKNDSKSPIIFNRYTQQNEAELVYGDMPIRLLYGTRPGQLFTSAITGPFLSQLYGSRQSSPGSRKKIPGFVKNFKINMDEYESGPFNSFNDFFIRAFKPERRPFVKEQNRLAAFAEARYFGFESVTEDISFPVKGSYLNAGLILGDKSLTRDFMGGPMLIARLCPTDYHRFHFPDSGQITKSYRVGGRLHSVNPLALKFKGDILATNERHVSILETKNFGKLAYIEVGALFVGKIVQTHKGTSFMRGQEKGYFLFGASTVIVMGTKKSFIPSRDILENTKASREVFIKLGDEVGVQV